jgi:hypothetical protein
LYQKVQFGSTDDLDEIGDRTEETAKEEKDSKPEGEEKDTSNEDDKKSYTNTVNSKEFREYLKKKGLLLFPVKPSNGVSQTSNGNLNQPLTKIIEKPNEMDQNDKKKNGVFSRLSSIFSKNKTTPKNNDLRASFGNRKDENRGSSIKRVILDRNDDNRSILANNEFLTSHNFSRRDRDDDEDKKSSISSVLTAAADDESVFDTPVVLRRNHDNKIPMYRNIDLTRSKLYQPKPQPQPRKPSNPPSFDNISQLSDDVIKPRVCRPGSINRGQPVQKSQIKPPVPLRRSSERQSLPVTRIDRRRVSHENQQSFSNTPPKLQNSYSDKAKFTSTPNEKDNSLKSPEVSPVKEGEIDPFTYAKIHEIKKKTDEVLLNKSLSFDNQQQQRLNNQNFIRNSSQRSSVDNYGNKSRSSLRVNENYRQPPMPQQPPRSQSVLDNMTCYKNSLYGEVVYRQPDGHNVNVIMRRPDSSTLDRKQIMQKIYEYYRKSVNNTPVPFQDQINLQKKTQSTDTSPISYVSENTMRATLPNKVPPNKLNEFSNWQNYSNGNGSAYSSVDRKNNLYAKPNKKILQPSRKPAISESDSEDVFIKDNNVRYVVVNSDKLTPHDVLRYQNQRNNNDRIYDVVYGSGQPNSGLYGYVKPKQMQQGRPTSAMDYASPISTRNRLQQQMTNGRQTPLILHQSSLPRHLPNQMDIIYNNQIYRPISAIPTKPQQQQQPRRPTYNDYQQAHYGMKKRDLMTPESETGSEANGEVHRIMQNRYYGELDFLFMVDVAPYAIFNGGMRGWSKESKFGTESNFGTKKNVRSKFQFLFLF